MREPGDYPKQMTLAEWQEKFASPKLIEGEAAPQPPGKKNGKLN